MSREGIAGSVGERIQDSYYLLYHAYYPNYSSGPEHLGNANWIINFAQHMGKSASQFAKKLKNHLMTSQIEKWNWPCLPASTLSHHALKLRALVFLGIIAQAAPCIKRFTYKFMNPTGFNTINTPGEFGTLTFVTIIPNSETKYWRAMGIASLWVSVDYPKNVRLIPAYLVKEGGRG